MCGIVGYVGPRPALEVLLPGLGRLEYRGYDSAGVAVGGDHGIAVVKQAGRISELADALTATVPAGHAGIGHTRWATHGAPTTENAHPLLDCRGKVAVVHNGIIENWAELKAQLVSEGHRFSSDTDSEVLAHLLEEQADVPLAAALRRVMRIVEGSLAVVVLRADEPDLVVGARRGSPLVVGKGVGENFLASDIPAFLAHTRDMIVLDDDRVVEVRPGSVRVTDLSGIEVTPLERTVDWDLEAAEKGGYETFMLKEIHEQPTAIVDTLRGRTERGRITLDELGIHVETLAGIDKVFVVACGSSFHAAMTAKYAIERWTRLPAETDIASEFRYRDPVVDARSLVIAISQSGETIDTLAAAAYARRQGATVVAVTNVVESALARESDGVLYTRAGPEIGVAATKTFTAQLVAMHLLGLHLAQARGTLRPDEVAVLVAALEALPRQVEEVLTSAGAISRLAASVAGVEDFFFLGRSGDFPVAMEGALKLKEIAYVRAEGYAAGEMKHGPIALVEPGVVVVGVATDGRVRAKTLSNLQEMAARGATIIALVERGEDELPPGTATHVVVVPPAPDLICTVTAVVPLQLLAYHVATMRGLDVDKPRNLAKTVTVE